jgi:hypothetical protein
MVPRGEGMDRMSLADEAACLQANVEVIREYLRSEFKDDELTEESDGNVSHLFTVTNLPAYRRHKLRISAPRLFDSNNTPASITRQLRLDNTAGQMRDPMKAGEILWGWKQGDSL